MNDTGVVPEQDERFLLFLKQQARNATAPSDKTARVQLCVVAGAWIVVGLLILLAVYLALQLRGHS